jgi:hypothetical protein
MKKTLGNMITGPLLVVVLPGTEAWVNAVSFQCGYDGRRTMLLFDSARSYDDDHFLNPQRSDARREQEIILEELSLKGAEKISKVDVAERARRAMLAEAVEDRVFELTDTLERMLEEDGSVKLENRDKVADTAKQTKELQQLYSDLVNGKPSTILTALANLGKTESDG